MKTTKIFSALLAVMMIMAMALTGCGKSENNTPDTSSTPQSTVSDTTSTEPKEGSSDAATALLTALKGTYEGLFAPVTFQSQYDSLWVDYCSAVVGADAGADMASMMKYSIGGSIYGQSAVDEYTKNPDSTQFCCEFTEELNELTFNGNDISGKKADGSELFSHSYEFVSYEAIGADEGVEGFNGYVFKSTDDNSGEFSYFIILPDTPATTHHIEFRYGSDLDALKQYASGKYAYWLAAGIPTNATAADIENAIALFCTENMDYTTERSESSLSAISSFVGAWDADLSSYGDAYKDTTLYTVIDKDGNGTTYMNGEQTRSYIAYAYDNDGDSETESGVYVAYDKGAKEAEATKYSITEGGSRLTIYDASGAEMISYTKR